MFLDWDGVLVDSLAIYFQLYQDLCRDYRKVLPIADLVGFRGWYEPRWEINFEAMGFSPVEFAEVLAGYEARLDYDQCRLFEGAAAMVKSLAADCPLAIVSTAPSRAIRARLAREGLADCVGLVIGGDDGTSDKVERLAQAMASLRVGGGVMVGDTTVDIEAGKANGLTTIGVSYGWFSPERIRATEPHEIVDEPGLLEASIRRRL